MAHLTPFEYARPGSLEELQELLASRAGVTPFYLAGGTDLMVAMRSGKYSPELVVDLKHLAGLGGVNPGKDDTLRIGALTTIHAVEEHELIRSRFTALHEGARSLGSFQVRNRATLGGNLANGSPTADMAIPLMAFNAEILTWSSKGERRMSAASFWMGAGKTALQQGEIITGIELLLDEGLRSAYEKLGPRNAMDIAIASTAVVLRLDSGSIREVRIALGGACPTPIRAHSAEKYLKGHRADPEHISQAGKLAADESNPRSSTRASREYRLAVIPVLVERALRHCLRRQGITDEINGQL